MQKRLTVPNSVLLPEVAGLLKEGKRVVLMTKGASMRPFIEGGRDSVELSVKEEYSVGDIVLARLTEDRFVLHRLVAVSECMTLKGDGNLTAVEKCRPSDICGAVVNIVRGSGKVVDCNSARFVRCSRMWRNSPYLFRRIVLALYRRLR